MKLSWWKKIKFKLRGIPDPTTEDSSTSITQTNEIYSKLQIFVSQVGHWFQINAQPFLRKMDWSLVRGSGFTLALSFVTASSVSTYSANMSFKLFSLVGKAEATREKISAGGGFIDSRTSGSSYHEIKDSVLKRNLFNSDGTLAPDENGVEGKSQKNNNINFDNVPCTAEKLPVEILGVIYTGDAKHSFVIIKDAKVQDADIYDPGKFIIDNEDYEIYKVMQGTVEFRKGDTKICVDVAGRQAISATANSEIAIAKPEATETIDLTDAEMKELLGPELSRAMSDAKLIPIPDTKQGNGQILGSQLLGITPGSIFDRLKLSNEDLIVEVNGISLKDPSNGFRLLEALQQQREISINFIRKGEPMVRKVHVK